MIPVSAARRLARELMGQFNAAPDVRAAVVACEVTAVTVDGGEDGEDLATVDYLGASVPVAHLSTYAPVVGHVVALLKQGEQFLILGRIIGTPPEES